MYFFFHTCPLILNCISFPEQFLCDGVGSNLQSSLVLGLHCDIVSQGSGGVKELENNTHLPVWSVPGLVPLFIDIIKNQTCPLSRVPLPLLSHLYTEMYQHKHRTGAGVIHLERWQSTTRQHISYYKITFNFIVTTAPVSWLYQYKSNPLRSESIFQVLPV